MTSDDMAEFSKAFIIFDRDADGTVSMDELKLVRFLIHFFFFVASFFFRNSMSQISHYPTFLQGKY